MTFDALDLSRERADDDAHGDESLLRAMERADRLREVSDVADMAVYSRVDRGDGFRVERAGIVRNDDEALAPMRGLLIGLAIGAGMWAAVVTTALVAS